MAVHDSVLVAVNSAAASVLFVAGVAKTVSPARLSRALNALFRRSGKGFTRGHVRLFAGVEILAALALAGTATRPAGAWAAGVLGASFALAGVLGLVRGGGTACGCLGAAGRPSPRLAQRARRGAAHDRPGAEPGGRDRGARRLLLPGQHRAGLRCAAAVPVGAPRPRQGPHPPPAGLAIDGGTP
ncbi:MauE/DoxX family redox-associated membrane protein [Actinomadura madurae]|uniref:MauE/DoxX family redox-associated membrane protein n=1 Tax=Actinomadura madurae TaxID=1993 RepID=UPI0035564B92